MDSKVEFLFLNEEDMIKAGVLDADRAVDTIGEVITLLSEGDYLMGGRAHNDHGVQLIFPEKSDIPNFPLADSADRRFMAMPAYLGGRFHMCGEKWYGSNGRNSHKGLPRSILMATLNDVETGQPLAYMSANLLSAMRTGAMPGLTAMYLARKDSRVLTILGAGVIGRTSLMAIMAKFPDLEVLKIKGSSKTSHTAHELADYARENYKSLKEIIICDTLEEVVRDADIIAEAVSVEPRKWPVIDPAWVKPGCTIISSGTMDMDLEFVRDHVTKVVDNIQMYEEYVNVYQEWDEDGNRISLPFIYTLPSMISTVSPGSPMILLIYTWDSSSGHLNMAISPRSGSENLYVSLLPIILSPSCIVSSMEPVGTLQFNITNRPSRNASTAATTTITIQSITSCL